MVLLEISTYILGLLPPFFCFDNVSNSILAPTRWFSRIRVEGLISKFASGSGRTGTDRQFFFINGRPCAPAKVQKAINEVYRTFNANQSPFVIANFVLPTGM
jgi:DNA mismatch repair ATPase MutL